MSGNMALKYVRSRYAEGDEGTDFARSRRQQKLIMAIKDKLTAKDVITNPKKIKSIYETLIQSFTSDLGSDFYPALLKLGLKVDKSQIRTISISEDQLYNPPISAKYDYQWVLVPKDGSFDTLSTNIKNFLNNSR